MQMVVPWGMILFVAIVVILFYFIVVIGKVKIFD